MNKTSVKVADLLTTLRENREEHEKEFKKAKKVWRKELKKAYERKIRKLDSDEYDFETFIENIIGLPKPVEYLDEYDTAIAQLEWEQEKVIDLDQSDFKKFVQNEWAWSRQFAASTSNYNIR